MSQILQWRSTGLLYPRTFEAEVVSIDQASGGYDAVEAGSGRYCRVRSALAGIATPRVGDTVLISSEGERGWITGITKRAETSDEKVTVRDRQGNLLFEHDPETGNNVIYPAAGDLEIAVPDGSLGLSSHERVTIRGREGVDIESGENLRVTSPRGAVAIGRTTFKGDVLNSSISRASLLFGRLAIKADRIFSHVREASSKVDELLHMKAGRLWAVVSEALDMRGGKATLKADDRVRIDGKRIDLG